MLSVVCLLSGVGWLVGWLVDGRSVGRSVVALVCVCGWMVGPAWVGHNSLSVGLAGSGVSK